MDLNKLTTSDKIIVGSGLLLFIAAIAAIGLAVGGFLKFQAGEDAGAAGSDPGSAPF